MFDGSDDYTLRLILDNVEHIQDLHFDLNRVFLEMQYANDLKEYELGIIDNDEFNRRRNGHYTACQQLYEKRKKR